MSAAKTNRRLDELSDCFDVFTLSPESWPVAVAAAMADNRTQSIWPRFPEAATIKHRRLGHGRGHDKSSAHASAIGELIEIASCSNWGDLNLEWAQPLKVGDGGWDPCEMNGFSEDQCLRREKWNRTLEHLDWIPPRHDSREPIAWVTAKEGLSNRHILIPADAAVIGLHDNSDDAAVSVADTNGCAAGPTPVAARLSALLELVERDATGRWWYGSQKARYVSTNGCPYATEIADHLLERGRCLRLLDITSDIALPTIAALAADPDGACVSIGVGTKLHFDVALQAALSELIQSEMRIAAALASRFVSPDLEAWFDEVSMADILNKTTAITRKKNTVSRPAPGSSDDVQLSHILEELGKVGCSVAFIDFTRPEFEIPVVRAVSRELCHWKPRFGRARLAGQSADPGVKLLRI